jgi:hypothetical protein ELI_3205|nr:MAG TPA: Minor capsid protein [Caudoviricetes sp.]
MSGSGFNIKVKMNSTNKILKDHGLDQDGRVQQYLLTTAERFMNPFIPMDNGMLRRNKTYPNNHSIKYTSPYAKYQYYGKMYISPKLGVSGIPLKSGRWWSPKGEIKIATSKNLTYHTSGTGPKWDKLMMQRRKNDLIKDVENYIKTGG